MTEWSGMVAKLYFDSNAGIRLLFACELAHTRAVFNVIIYFDTDTLFVIQGPVLELKSHCLLMRISKGQIKMFIGR